MHPPIKSIFNSGIHQGVVGYEGITIWREARPTDQANVTISASRMIVRGRLKPDGTVELDDPPNPPAGPVEVMLRPLPPAGETGKDWWQYLQRVRGEAKAAGGPFRSREEIESEREEIRSGDDRIENILRQSDSAQADENP